MEIKEILLVDLKAPISTAIGFILQSQGYLVLLAPDVETAAAELNDHQVDLLLAYLNGHEEDKLDLLRQTKKRFPQTKVMLAGDPRKMAWQAFQEEVDDYLLVPFSPSELCRRVNHCLNQTKIPGLGSAFKGRGGKTNDPVLNSLRLKFRDINETILSLMANINILIQKSHDILNDDNLLNINNISDEFLSMMTIVKEFLDNQLLELDMSQSSGKKAKVTMETNLGRIAAAGMP